jgi:hypothetical protein
MDITLEACRSGPQKRTQNAEAHPAGARQIVIGRMGIYRRRSSNGLAAGDHHPGPGRLRTSRAIEVE